MSTESQEASDMSIKYITRMGATVTTILLLAAGCATQEGAVTQADLDALRDEAAMVRTDSKVAADSAATAAADAAGARAAADVAAASAAAAAADAAAARAAAEEVKEIYMQSLRK
jgi:hypothetical protein